MQFVLIWVALSLGIVVLINLYVLVMVVSTIQMGKVVRGPAPLSLALAHVDIEDDAVLVKQWSETDFRTNENPWWA